MNRVQFQPGLSMPEFTKLYGTEAQCEAALVQSRWPTGFSCPACHRQTSLIAGTLFQDSNLPLTTWFLAIYLVSQAKTSLSGVYHAFDFGKCAGHYLAAIAYRFNRRFQLKTLPERLLVAAVTTGPRPEAWLRRAEDSF